MRDGRLEAIFRRWDMWNDDQPRLYARVLAGSRHGAGPASSRRRGAGRVGGDAPVPPGAAARRVITLVLSCLSMVLAVALGVLIASGRVYGAAPLQVVLTAWVEVIRGTPLLLQLFVLYFGLAAVVQLPAFLAGAHRPRPELRRLRERDLSQRARGGAGAVSSTRRARSGFSDRQTLMLVRGPQAFRLALAPMTNDFVALLKDSSLVSVITVVELTKQTSIFAANIGSWVVPGAAVRARCIWRCRCRWRAWRAASRRGGGAHDDAAACVTWRSGAAAALVVRGRVVRAPTRRAAWR